MADRSECNAIARRQAVRLNDQPLFIPYFVTVRDNKGRVRNLPVIPFQQFGPPVWMSYAPHLAIDQQTLQNDLFRGCMEEKGYQLVPKQEGRQDDGDKIEGKETEGSAGEEDEPVSQAVPASPAETRLGQ